MFSVKRRAFNIFCFVIFFAFSYELIQFSVIKNKISVGDLEAIIGASSRLPAHWVGTKDVNQDIAILILAGHADSQGLAGAGTPGEAVDKFGLDPMDPGISDELFWNLKLQESIV